MILTVVGSKWFTKRGKPRINVKPTLMHAEYASELFTASAAGWSPTRYEGFEICQLKKKKMIN